LVRLSSWCITWRWPLAMFIICLGNKASNMNQGMYKRMSYNKNKTDTNWNQVYNRY
jgi:hypothetical protein